MASLVIPEHRRKWETCPRVCQICGEGHAYGSPTPSGRPCAMPKETAHTQWVRLGGRKSDVAVGMKKEPKAISKALSPRACKVCLVSKNPGEFSGLGATRCMACRVEAKRRAKERSAAATRSANSRRKRLDKK